MKTALNAADRRELSDRILRLTPEAPAQWGRMTASQMVVHLSDCLLMAFGELAVSPKKLPLRYTPIKQFVIYLMPFPKGAPTAPELIARSAGDWTGAIAELRTLLDQVGTKTVQGPWPDHPAFGRLTGRQWGVLIYRHTDHHLRQFGV